jgi:hypothetical protein
MAIIQGLYLALFGRPADPINLAYFNFAIRHGSDVSALAVLSEQQECRMRFAGMPAREIVETMHGSLFARAMDAASLAMRAEDLSSGRRRAEQIAIDLLADATGRDAETLGAKLAAANLFSSRLERGDELAAYSGARAAIIGRGYIDQVTAQRPATAKMVEDAILMLICGTEKDSGATATAVADCRHSVGPFRRTAGGSLRFMGEDRILTLKPEFR